MVVITAYYGHNFAVAVRKYLAHRIVARGLDPEVSARIATEVTDSPLSHSQGAAYSALREICRGFRSRAWMLFKNVDPGVQGPYDQ